MILLPEICDELWKVCLDGAERAIILRYKNIQSKEPLPKLLRQLMGDLREGESKGKVYQYIQKLETQENKKEEVVKPSGIPVKIVKQSHL